MGPSEAKADPERALTNFEDCSTCNHTCSGGICNEDKKDIIESNICVSQLTCGTCLKESGCAWCPDEGNAHCNFVTQKSTKMKQDVTVRNGVIQAMRSTVFPVAVEPRPVECAKIALWELKENFVSVQPSMKKIQHSYGSCPML